MNHKTAAQWVGQPVVVVLNDGSYYVGVMNSVESDGVTLSGLRAENKLPSTTDKSEEKAQISGFLSTLLGLPSPTAGLSPEAGSTGPVMNNVTQMLGFFNQMVPNIKIGMNIMKSIMPLFTMFK